MIGSAWFIIYVFSAYFNRSLIWVNIGQCHHSKSKGKKKIIYPLYIPTLKGPQWKAEEECLTCHPSCSLLLVNIQLISSREPSLYCRKQRCKAPWLCSTPGCLEKPQGTGFLVFEKILTPVFLTFLIQMFKPGCQHGCLQSWSENGIEVNGSSQMNMAGIITVILDMGRRLRKHLLASLFGVFIHTSQLQWNPWN